VADLADAPAVGHEIDAGLLSDIAGRCIMTGGQIRNAALNASVLAFEDGGGVKSAHVELAVLREYRKLGAVWSAAPPRVPGHGRPVGYRWPPLP